MYSWHVQYATEQYPWYLRHIPLVETGKTPVHLVAQNIYRHFAVNLQMGELSEREANRLPQWEQELAAMSRIVQH